MSVILEPSSSLLIVRYYGFNESPEARGVIFFLYMAEFMDDNIIYYIQGGHNKSPAKRQAVSG